MEAGDVEKQSKLATDRIFSNKVNLSALSIVVLSLTLSFLHLYVGWFQRPEAYLFRSTHVALIMILAILTRPLGKSEWFEVKKRSLFDWACIAVIIVMQGYILICTNDIYLKYKGITYFDFIIGILYIIVLLEITRRVVGKAMLLVALVFLIYSLESGFFPGLLRAAPTSLSNLIIFNIFQTDGIFGSPINTMASIIMLVMIFGSLLLATGAGKFFIEVAYVVAGRQTGGPAKVAVIASALFGMISGSASSNVATTGSFTIPLMKRVGYSPSFAGAVEAVSSVGGQVMPPVMGASAFLMAEFLGVPYFEIVKIAFFPALIYFVAVFFSVHFRAVNTNLPKIPASEVPRLRTVLSRGWYHLIPVVVLLYPLFQGRSIQMAISWAIISVLVVGLLKKNNRITPVAFLRAIEGAVQSGLVVAIACASAGLIVGSVFTSGLSFRLAGVIVEVGGGILVPTLLITMVAAIVFGMGMTTSAIYITLAALVAPALIKMGVIEKAAHLFLVYYGVVSGITPPVAIAAFAAAAISKANPMSTGWQALKIALPGFLLPFAFVLNPPLLLQGTLAQIITIIVLTIIGVVAAAAAVEGWLFMALSYLERTIVLIAACAVIIWPSHFVNLVCSTVLVLFAGYKYIQSRKKPATDSLGILESHKVTGVLNAESIKTTKKEGLVVLWIPWALAIGVLIFLGNARLHMVNYNHFLTYLVLTSMLFTILITYLYRRKVSTENVRANSKGD